MKTAMSLILAALAGAGIMYWQGARENARLHAEVKRLMQIVDDARTAAEAAELAAAATPGAPSPAAQPVEKIVTVKVPDDPSTRKELLRLLDEKNARLSSSDAALSELRERMADVESKLTQTMEEKVQLAAAQKDLKEQLDIATRLTESLREQSRSREERLARAEVSSADLRKRGDETARKLARLSDLTAQMEDVARRRDGYISSLLRRVREATELFRTLALRSDDPNLARIQQTISAADEDLRQLQTLSAEAAKLQRDQALAHK